jgi:hypothetical protein
MFFGNAGFVGKRIILPAGTFLYSACVASSGNDANGTFWTGTWNLMSYYADGIGGFYGSNTGQGVSPCFYPAGFVSRSNTVTNSFTWNASNGDTGTYTYNSSFDYDVQNGLGGYANFQGGSTTPTGQVFYNFSYLGQDYTLNYDGNGGYYETVACPTAGSYIGDGCFFARLTDAVGTEWDTTAMYGLQYHDGNCGTYVQSEGINYNGCWYPVGFAISRDVSYGSFTYYDIDNNQQTFVFSESWTLWTATENGGQIDTIGGSQQPTGYIFYSYYDYSNGTTLYYRFDGINGYYTEYA